MQLGHPLWAENALPLSFQCSHAAVEHAGGHAAAWREADQLGAAVAGVVDAGEVASAFECPNDLCGGLTRYSELGRQIRRPHTATQQEREQLQGVPWE